MLSRMSAEVGLPAPRGASTVAPVIRPPAVSAAITPVTKYFDLIAAHWKGPLIARRSPGSRPLKSVRSVSSRLVTSARSRWFSSTFASVLAIVGPIPTRSVPPLGPMSDAVPDTRIR